MFLGLNGVISSTAVVTFPKHSLDPALQSLILSSQNLIASKMFNVPIEILYIVSTGCSKVKATEL